jgi:zinc transporter ZupT
MQFYTSIAAFLGTIVGLLTEGVGVWNEILLAVTSGGFIYVATSSLIPSVLNKTPENSPSSRYTQVTSSLLFLSLLTIPSSSPSLQIILECLGFSIGVMSMYIVGLLE